MAPGALDGLCYPVTASALPGILQYLFPWTLPPSPPFHIQRTILLPSEGPKGQCTCHPNYNIMTVSLEKLSPAVGIDIAKAPCSLKRIKAHICCQASFVPEICGTIIGIN